jgi:hypothetical protein
MILCIWHLWYHIYETYGKEKLRLIKRVGKSTPYPVVTGGNTFRLGCGETDDNMSEKKTHPNPSTKGGLGGPKNCHKLSCEVSCDDL